MPESIETSQLSPPPLRLPAFRALVYVQACFGLAYSTFLILPKFLATHAGADADQIGGVMASASIANVIAAPLVARLVRRVGLRAALVLANLTLATGAICFVGVDAAGPLAISARAVQGLAWALSFSAGSALVIVHAPAGRLGQAIALHSSANLITNAISPAIAEPAIAAVGSRVVFGAAALVALVAATLALRVRAAAPARLETVALGRPPLYPSRVAPPLSLPRLLFVNTVLGLACGTMLTFHQPLALQRGIWRVSDFLVAYTLAAVFVRVAGGRITERIGPGRIAFGSFLFYGAVVACMPALGPGGLGVLGACFGLAHGLFFPAFMALSVAGTPPAHRDRVLAGINATFNGGAVAVAGLGVVAEHMGFLPVFVPVGLLVGASAWLLRPAAVRRPVRVAAKVA